jgi:hypothetical protein
VIKRSRKKLREEARRLFLTGEMDTNTEIAARLGVKPHTIGQWRRTEDWEGLRRKIDRRAAELFVEKIATDRVTLNTQHFQLFGLVINQLLGALKSANSDKAIRTLDKAAGILERAQKGQRLARGLATDGETEEQIRAEAQAEIRRLIDAFIEAVKENVPDEPTRDRIRRAVLAALPREAIDGVGDTGDPGRNRAAG